MDKKLEITQAVRDILEGRLRVRKDLSQWADAVVKFREDNQCSLMQAGDVLRAFCAYEGLNPDQPADRLQLEGALEVRQLGTGSLYRLVLLPAINGEPWEVGTLSIMSGYPRTKCEEVAKYLRAGLPPIEAFKKAGLR